MNPSEHLPGTGGPEGTDAASQHERFRQLFQSVVEQRRLHFPEGLEDDWVTACYESQEAFRRHFPNWEACQGILLELEARARACAEEVASRMERVRREGLSYLDLEALRYELPEYESGDGTTE